jgi:hypothetical protein
MESNAVESVLTAWHKLNTRLLILSIKLQNMLVTFYPFIGVKDLMTLKNLKNRTAQKLYARILQHYNRTTEQGLHLLHFEDYFETPVELLCMALQMDTSTIDWKLMDVSRKKFGLQLQQQRQNGTHKSLSPGPGRMKKVNSK